MNTIPTRTSEKCLFLLKKSIILSFSFLSFFLYSLILFSKLLKLKINNINIIDNTKARIGIKLKPILSPTLPKNKEVIAKDTEPTPLAKPKLTL